MPVSNIADITGVIISRIKDALADSQLWSAATIPDVFPDPLTIEDPPQGISFYLYHVRENARFKNVIPAGNDQPRVKLNPMGLDLYFQMTALKSRTDDASSAYDEQKMMSVALKALHDTPVLSLGEDQFRITLQPVPASEAVHNWTAGSSPLKLSAYYEVSPVMLEPEPAKLYSGRVLMYGNYVSTSGAPRITGSSSRIEFTLPGESTPKVITASPAQAIPGTAIVFNGNGFVSDDAIQLRIYNSRFEEHVVAPNWNPVVSTTAITVTVDTTARLERNGDIVDVLPGIYTAQFVTTKTFTLPGGTTKDIRQSSNQFPFSVLPEVISMSLAGDVLTVQGWGFQVMPDPLLANQEEMEVYTGETRLLRSGSLLSTGPGEFRVISSTQLELRLPASVGPGTLAVRVMVAGAESNPAWQEII